GGAPVFEKRNQKKAALLYDALDGSSLFSCPVEKDSRSPMNVVFRLAGGDEALESKFAKAAADEGIVGIVGHRSVGGMRVSLYNAVTLEAVESLTSFMREFERSQA